MPITLGNTDITGLTGALVMPDTTNSSFVGPVIRNYGGEGAIAGVYFQGYDWVQGGIWHGRGASGTNRSGALVLGTNPDTADLSKQGLIGRLIIDNAGRVRMPYQPAFYARRTSGYGSSGVTPFDDISLNVGGHFSGTRFTAPVAGVYYATGSWLPNSSSGANGSIQKNGNRVSANAYNLASDNHATATAIVSLAASDYLEFYISGDGTEGAYCHFGAYLIG
jgi:hypothetical protein